ncbi:MAG: hypothetical protein RL657_1417 [Pseudomonadota bacterium]
MRNARPSPEPLSKQGRTRIYRGPAEWTHWPRLNQALADVTLALEDSGRLAAEFVLEEWFVNLCTHGQINAGRVLQAMVYWRNTRQDWELLLLDDGLPFDPTQRSHPDTRAPLAERGKGGMGIYLSLKMTRNNRYERQGPFNAWWLRWHPS